MQELIIVFNEMFLKTDLHEFVRKVIEDTLNSSLKDVGEILWGSSVSAATISKLDEKVLPRSRRDAIGRSFAFVGNYLVDDRF